MGKGSFLKKLLFHSAAGTVIALCWAGIAMASDGVPIDSNHFPDDNFRKIVENFDNGDKVLSEDEINDVKVIEVGGSVGSLDGIENFKALTSFDLHDNSKITSLDLRRVPALTRLVCNGTQGLSSINVNGCTSLTTIMLKDFYLSSIDLGGCRALKTFWTNTGLESLDVSDCSALEDLSCDYTNTLKLGNLSALKKLSCSNGKLTSLDLSGCPALEYLLCHTNQITKLDISKCPKLEAHYFNNDYYARKSSEEIRDTDKPFVFDASVTLITSKGTFEPAKDPEPSKKQQQAEKETAAADRITILRKPSLKKPKAAKNGKITISWPKFRQTKKTKAIWKKIKKIEVQYSTDPSFKADVQRKVIGKKKTKLTIKKLQKGTAYYVRIRYSDGAGGYSQWSKVRKVKTKKR